MNTAATSQTVCCVKDYSWGDTGHSQPTPAGYPPQTTATNCCTRVLPGEPVALTGVTGVWVTWVSHSSSDDPKAAAALSLPDMGVMRATTWSS